MFVRLKLEAAFRNMDNDLSRHAEDNKKNLENLISQLNAAAKEQQTIIKQYQKANETSTKEQKTKDKVIKELKEDLHKTNLASENSKVEHGNSHSLEKKLAESERQLTEANNIIKILKQEKEQIEKEFERKEIEILECRKFICSQKEKTEKLYEQLKQQGRESVMLREQLEKTNRQHHENLNRVEEERDAVKHQVEEWVKKNHTTVCVQMYAAVNKELCEKMMNELEGMLSLQFEMNNTLIEVEKHKQPPTDSDLPLLVLCINASRLGTDVNQALHDVSRSRTVAVVVLHHKEIHALPRQPSEKLLIGSDYKHIGAIVDIAYLTSKGIYPCDMNERSLDRIVNFIKSNSKTI